MSYAQLQLRRGTAAEWASANPVLAIAEMAVETDTGQFKIGNGVTNWVSLPYGGVQGPPGTGGVATSVEDFNSANALTQWVGTTAEYNALGTWDANRFYNLTDAEVPGGGTGGGPVAWNDITGKPSTYPPSTHTHPISEVTNLQSSLNAKLDASATAAQSATITDQGAGATLKMWYGTEAQYSAIVTKDATTVYFRSA